MITNAYSVLMSVYAKENPEWLRESMDSMLVQTTPPAEMVVVKDGALSRALEEVLDEYSEMYPGLFNFVAYSENQGLGYALHKGVLACRNPIIARMDTDDIAVPERMEMQLRAMREYDLDMVGSQVIEFDGELGTCLTITDLPEEHEEILKYSKRRNPFRHPPITFKRAAVLAAGNYSSDFLYFEDWDLFNRMLSVGCKSKNLHDPLVYMRVNGDFYARRGGMRYLAHAYRFKKAQLERGWFTLRDFCLSFTPQAVVCLMPNSIRSYLYTNYLRKAPDK